MIAASQQRHHTATLAIQCMLATTTQLQQLDTSTNRLRQQLNSATEAYCSILDCFRELLRAAERCASPGDSVSSASLDPVRAWVSQAGADRHRRALPALSLARLREAATTLYPLLEVALATAPATEWRDKTPTNLIPHEPSRQRASNKGSTAAPATPAAPVAPTEKPTRAAGSDGQRAGPSQAFQHDGDKSGAVRGSGDDDEDDVSSTSSAPASASRSTSPTSKHVRRAAPAQKMPPPRRARKSSGAAGAAPHPEPAAGSKYACMQAPPRPRKPLMGVSGHQAVSLQDLLSRPRPAARQPRDLKPAARSTAPVNTACAQKSTHQRSRIRSNADSTRLKPRANYLRARRAASSRKASDLASVASSTAQAASDFLFDL